MIELFEYLRMSPYTHGDRPPSGLLYNAAIYKLKILPCLPETQPAIKVIDVSQKKTESAGLMQGSDQRACAF